MTGRHWLESIDHASNNPAIRQELREMVTRETTAAHAAGLAERDTALEQLAGWFESEADSSHGGWADAAHTAADRIRAVVAGEVACSQCQEQPAEEHGMCASCLHDARRSGWDPPAPAETITLHVHQHDLDQPCPPTCPHAGTEQNRGRGEDDLDRPDLDPPPAGLVDRLRQRLAAELPAYIFPTSALAAAVAEEQHQQSLVAQHAGGLRRAFGPGLRHAELYGTGWIRIDCKPAPDQSGIFDWTFSSPNPTTIVVRDDPAPGDRPMTDRPSLADRAAAASATPKTAEVDKLLEHQHAGAYARSVLTEQLEAARLERDGTLDMLETYQEQFEAEQLRVQQLELAIADLDEAAPAEAGR